MRTKYEYEGKQYSLNGLAELSQGLCPPAIRARLKLGWTVKQAVETPPHYPRAYMCEIDGAVVGVTELSAMTGLKKDTIYHRIARGETLQDIADNPERKREKELTYQGKPCTITDIAELSGVCRNTVKNRLRRGETPESIVAKGSKAGTNNRQYLYKGKLFKVTELAKLPECTVSFSALRGRLLGRGWTVEAAVTTPYVRKKARNIA